MRKVSCYLEGYLVGIKGKICLRMEAVCDDSFRAWHLNFGTESIKDVTVIDQTNLLADIKNKKWITVIPNFVVGAYKLLKLFYLDP